MAVKKLCQYCGASFIPDKRIGDRQKACSAACQKLRKRDNNRSFSRNNPGYWRGRYGEVKQWRQARARWRETMKPAEIQAELFAKALDNVDRNVHLLFKIQAEMLLHVIEVLAIKRRSVRRPAVRYKPR